MCIEAIACTQQWNLCGSSRNRGGRGLTRSGGRHSDEAPALSALVDVVLEASGVLRGQLALEEGEDLVGVGASHGTRSAQGAMRRITVATGGIFLGAGRPRGFFLPAFFARRQRAKLLPRP